MEDEAMVNALAEQAAAPATGVPEVVGQTSTAGELSTVGPLESVTAKIQGTPPLPTQSLADGIASPGVITAVPAEEAKPPHPLEPVMAKIREHIAGKDIGQMRWYESFHQLYPDHVTMGQFNQAWQAVMNEPPAPAAKQPAAEDTGGPKPPPVAPERA